MSRIGKQPIVVPKGVDLKVEGSAVSVKGPKGELSMNLPEKMQVKKEGDDWIVVPEDDSYELRKFHGLSRSLVSNMVEGVSKGFTKSLTLIGVGYRAAVQGSDLNLTLGYSHPIVYKAPKGIQIKVEKNTTVIIEGADKQAVGQVAADIRSYRPPEPYHGKGVRYSDETIITKVGKSGSK